MTWNVEITKPAYKQLRAMPKMDRARVLSALREMAHDPYSGDIKWIDKQRGVLRRRVGSWRVFFVIVQDILYVPIIAIKRRDSKTYS